MTSTDIVDETAAVVGRLRRDAYAPHFTSVGAANLMIEAADLIERLSGTIRADDERLKTAGARVGIIAGCDTADQMADEIERLSRERDTGVPFTTKEWEWIASGLGNFVEYVMPDGEETEVRALLKKVEALSAAPQPPDPVIVECWL